MKLISRFRTVELGYYDSAKCGYQTLHLKVVLWNEHVKYSWLALLGIQDCKSEFPISDYVVYEDGFAECLTEKLDEHGFPINSPADYSRVFNQFIHISEDEITIQESGKKGTYPLYEITVSSENSLKMSITF